MKKYHSFLMLLLCSFTVLSLSSCLDDDDDSSDYYTNLTSAQKVTLLYNSAGSYSGKIYYPADDNSTIADSVDTYLAMSPSIASSDTCEAISMTFPLETLNKYVGNDSTVLQEAGSAQLTANAYIYTTQLKDYINQSFYSLYFKPDDLTVTSGDNTISISFVTDSQLSFIGNYYGPYLYILNYSEVEAYLLVKNITINNYTYDIERPFIIHVTK
ncbi:MAG: hypothetical protein ACOYJF_03855 [Prevotella sp.]